MAEAKHSEHTDLETIISRAIAAHERSLQLEPGPSDLGTPCDRKLTMGFARVKPVNLTPSADWRPTVGVAVHTWLAKAMERENRRIGEKRFLIEQRLAVGRIHGDPMYGHLDVYDSWWPGIIDWKVVGVTTLRKVRSYGVGEAYRTQQHIYGRGVARGLKLPVEHVACYFLPNNGVLKDGHFWHEPYNPDYADKQFQRARDISAAVDIDAEAAIVAAPLHFDYCGHCPYFTPGSKISDPKRCPGDPEMAVRSDSSLDGLI